MTHTINLNAISIADVLKNINKEDKENLEKYSFVTLGELLPSTANQLKQKM